MWMRLVIDHGEVKGFVTGLRKFLRRLGDEAGDPYWKPILRRLRRVRYEVTSVPLPLPHPALNFAGTADELQRLLRTCGALYPSYERDAGELVSTIERFSASEDDPLGDAVALILENAGFHNLRDALLLRARGFGEAVRTHLKQRGLRVITLAPEELTGRMAASNLIAVGPSAWFPTHVTTAPRAQQVTFVHYRWIRDDEPRAGLLEAVSSRSRPVQLHRSSLAPQVEEAFAPHDLLPVIDWSGIAGRGPSAHADDHDLEVLLANLYLLAGGFAVYLEAEGGYQIYGFDLAAETEERVRRVQAARVTSGMYLVLRREGGGDYIPIIADRILRERARGLREMQRDWKERLRSEVAKFGVADVVRKLRSFGGSGRSEMNVRYWCSYDSIATGRYADFLAIMRLVQLEGRAEELWDAMGHIRRAHLAAGQHVRRLLEEQVEKADLSMLAERGMMDFSLEESSGRLTVFRVEASSPELFTVPRGQLRHPFPVERDMWHA